MSTEKSLTTVGSHGLGKHITWLGVVGVFLICATSWADNWPQFGGPDGSGHTAEKDVPVKWSADDVVYRAQLPGNGQSSAIIWGDQVFLTTSTDKGHQRLILGLDRATGKVKWTQSVPGGDKPEKLNGMNTWATPSCVTDGKRVIAFFGPAGLHCYSMDGKKKLWSKKLGSFPGSWGVAASPVIIGDMVIQNCDSESDNAYLLALNKETGKEIWRNKRGKALPRGGWSTPILINTGKRQELVLNSEFGAQAYDPASGKDLWFCKSFNGRGTPVPAWAHGLVIVVNGKPGDVYAIKPGGSGDVTKTHMKWHTSRRGGRDLPSPIVSGQYLFTVSMNGTAACYDAPTGEELWTEKLGGAQCSASPIVANGLIYVLDEVGQVTVIKPGPKLEIVARNKLPVKGREMFRSAMSVSDGQIFIRSHQALYCIGKKR